MLRIELRCHAATGRSSESLVSPNGLPRGNQGPASEKLDVDNIDGTEFVREECFSWAGDDAVGHGIYLSGGTIIMLRDSQRAKLHRTYSLVVARDISASFVSITSYLGVFLSPPYKAWRHASLGNCQCQLTSKYDHIYFPFTPFLLEKRHGVNPQAPLGTVRSCSGASKNTAVCTQRSQLGMSSTDEPWFAEAKATVLLNLDELE